MGVVDILTASSEQFDHSFTLVDIELPNEPAIYVNGKFEQLTGYNREETLGRNLRFLQGNLTSKSGTAKIRYAINKRWAFYADLINYQKDGTPFWDRMVLLPLEQKGHIFYMGMQADVTKQKEAAFGSKIDRLTPTEAIHAEICHVVRGRLNVIMLAQEMSRTTLSQDRLAAHQRLLRQAVDQLADFVMHAPWERLDNSDPAQDVG